MVLNNNYIAEVMLILLTTSVSGGVLPNLRYSPFNRQKEVWHQVIIEGILSSKGMVPFKSVLSDNDAQAIMSL